MSAINLSEQIDRKWDVPEIRIRNIREFSITGVVTKVSDVISYGNGGKMKKFTISDGNSVEDEIQVILWTKDVEAYGGVIRPGNKYRIIAPHAEQTRKVDYGVESEHVCTLKFHKGTILHLLEGQGQAQAPPAGFRPASEPPRGFGSVSQR